MALVNCKECGTKISDKALACPKCGATQNDNSEKQGLNKSVENVFISEETKTAEIDNLTPQTKEQIGETPTSKKTNSRFKWILLGIMTVFLIGGVILLLRKSPEELFEIAENYKVQGNNVEAVKYYNLAAEKGHLEAIRTLAEMYQLGYGISKNSQEALKWYRLAAEQGDVLSQLRLALLLYDEGTGLEQNGKEIVKWMRKAAEQGNLEAQNLLGKHYQDGAGVEKDYNEAAKWFRKAANQGNADAQCNLGYLYHKGLGVIQDHQEAAKWFRKAANQGNAIAQYNLAIAYYEGLGVESNYFEAIKWMEMAAEQGHTNAILALKMYMW